MNLHYVFVFHIFVRSCINKCFLYCQLINMEQIENKYWRRKTKENCLMKAFFFFFFLLCGIMMQPIILPWQVWLITIQHILMLISKIRFLLTTCIHIQYIHMYVILDYTDILPIKCLSRLQMYGLVAWLYMLCWWEHILLRILKSQRTSARQYM